MNKFIKKKKRERKHTLDEIEPEHHWHYNLLFLSATHETSLKGHSI